MCNCALHFKVLLSDKDSQNKFFDGAVHLKLADTNNNLIRLNVMINENTNQSQ